MATRIITSIIDDIDGTEGAETVSFSLEGHDYEIDLTPANHEVLRQALAPYIAAARPSPNGAVKPKATGGDVKAIRAWAAAKGIVIPARGRIPADVRDRYTAEAGK
jgi:hypothetical protein